MCEESKIQQIMNLTGKVAIVTGAGKGVGAGIANWLADAGANVAVMSRTLSDLEKVVSDIEAMGRRGLAVAGDVSKAADVNRLVDSTVKEFGKVDILVNNAAIFPYYSFFDLTEEQWDQVQNINIKGMFLCCQAVAKEMVKQGNGGKIVNIASIEGEFPLTAGRVHYHASKGAVINFTRGLAKELAEYKINVNAIAPGMTDTPGLSDAMGGWKPDAITGRIPLGRLGQPDDIAKAVMFMASDAADYVTGAILFVDGGLLLGRGWKRIG
ncbi:MAG: 3-oxoacyl-ACP reductase family protein [Chloroflexota bacterium]|nr:3-oxoacyl-ACP reductase family protein [Chloroflexota bacterium]